MLSADQLISISAINSDIAVAANVAGRYRSPHMIRSIQLSVCRRVVTLLFDATTCLHGFVSFDESAFSFTYSCLFQCMIVLGLGGRRFRAQQSLHRL